ncbi:MAG TPA: hypothetical protein VIO60_00245 [Rectinemataceae bacterium]
MKKALTIIALCATLLFVGCVQDVLPPVSDTVLELEIGMAKGISGSRAITYNAGDTAWARAFDANRNRVAIGPGGTYESTLTWDSGISKWRGSIDLSAFSGNITFLAGVQNSEKEHIYRGSMTKTITPDNRNENINLTAAISYSIGDIGPGGGYIFYDKGSYGTDGWRYLEAAPTDLSTDWTEDKVGSGYVIYQGEVYTDNAPVGYGVEDTKILTKYDFYWGPAGSASTTPKYTYNTLSNLGKGPDNFAILDALTTVTPKIRNKPGRKDTSLNDNPRRDTPDTIHAINPNSMNDWFIPSLNELQQLYVSREKVAGLDSAAKYWSSTEDLTADQWSVESGLNIPNASAWDFNTGALAEITRDNTCRVRPSRRF